MFGSLLKKEPGVAGDAQQEMMEALLEQITPALAPMIEKAKKEAANYLGDNKRCIIIRAQGPDIYAFVFNMEKMGEFSPPHDAIEQIIPADQFLQQILKLR